MRQFALIGQNIGHSFSPSFFRHKFQKENIKDVHYKSHDLKNLEEIDALIVAEKLEGFNVTIPFKEQIIPYLDHLSEDAQVVGAVNCVKIKNDQKFGYNTDVYGFQKSLENFLKGQKPKALVLGNGGAAKAVCFVLKQMNINFQIVARNGEFRFEEINQTTLQNHHLLINCTPLGTYPKVEEKPPLPYQFLDDRHFLFDLIYNPNQTSFLRLGEKNGAKIKNGYEMLVLQAEKSWEIWNELL